MEYYVLSKNNKSGTKFYISWFIFQDQFTPTRDKNYAMKFTTKKEADDFKRRYLIKGFKIDKIIL